MNASTNDDRATSLTPLADLIANPNAYLSEQVADLLNLNEDTDVESVNRLPENSSAIVITFSNCERIDTPDMVSTFQESFTGHGTLGKNRANQIYEEAYVNIGHSHQETDIWIASVCMLEQTGEYSYDDAGDRWPDTTYTSQIIIGPKDVVEESVKTDIHLFRKDLFQNLLSSLAYMDKIVIPDSVEPFDLKRMEAAIPALIRLQNVFMDRLSQ